MARKIVDKIKQIDKALGIPSWLCYILALIILLRIPSFFEPYNYGDEMIYLTLGNAIRHGLTLYSQIHDNKPPLLYLIAAIAGNLFWFKAILMFWLLATTVAFHHLARKLMSSDLSVKVAVIFFAILTSIPLLEGNIANAELFLIGPIILGIFLLLDNPPTKQVFLAGVAFGIATLFKVPAIFDLPVVIIYMLLVSKDIKNISQIIKKGLILALGLAVPILVTLIWYLAKGALNDYIRAAFIQNIGYVSSWGTNQISFVIKYGPLLIKGGIVLIALIFLRINKTRLSKAFLIASIWTLTSLFAATLSGRPYPHYLVQVIPPVALLVGILVTSKKFEQVLTILPLALVTGAAVFYHFWYYSTTTYYERFVQFATHQISKEVYFNKFNDRTVKNYEIAQKIQSLVMPNEKIFVWGEDAPVIYALSRRLPAIKYTANYHITDFSSLDDTLGKLKANPPALIIVLPDSKKFTQLNTLLVLKYVEISNDGGEIWRLIVK